MPDTAASPVCTDQHQEDLQLMLQMATVIRQQADAIADLRRRVTVLEEAADGSIPSTRPAAEGRPMASPQRGQAGTAPGLAPGDARASRETAVRVSAPAPPPGVFFRGFIYEGTGYGGENWQMVIGLTEHKVPVQLVPQGDDSDAEGLIPAQSRKSLAALKRQLVDIPRSIVYQAAPASIWESIILGRRTVGRTMFETDRIPHSFVERCNTMDEVWLPCRFNMETFAAAGVDEHKLRLVPAGVDAQVFRPGVNPLLIPKKRRFNFLSVFDWQLRKGYDALLRAYLQEFKADGDVALILKVPVTGSSTAEVEAKVNFLIERDAGIPLEKAPTIILMNGLMPQQKMPALYAAADAFVLPSRGEGYGRPYLEALACQLPVIATNWGGQRDFLTSQNSYLIETGLVPVGDDVDAEIYRGHCWGEPNVEHLRELMREVYSHPDEARTKAKQGREDILRKYDWSVVTPLWVREFQRLLE